MENTTKSLYEIVYDIDSNITKKNALNDLIESNPLARSVYDGNTSYVAEFDALIGGKYDTYWKRAFPKKEQGFNDRLESFVDDLSKVYMCDKYKAAHLRDDSYGLPKDKLALLSLSGAGAIAVIGGLVLRDWPVAVVGVFGAGGFYAGGYILNEEKRRIALHDVRDSAELADLLIEEVKEIKI